MCGDRPELEVDSSVESDSAYSGDMLVHTISYWPGSHPLIVSRLSYATSISSSVKHYRSEYGRRFHAYKDGCTGIWAIEAGDTWPSATVVGNDLSPIQPQWLPPNVTFEVDDVEAEWPDRAQFDFIHSRYMAGSLGDWPQLMSRCFQNLEAGGWVEFQDYEYRYYADDGSLPDDSQLKRMSELLVEGCSKIGRNVSPGPSLLKWVKDAGFVNIGYQVIKLPLGAWPKDPVLKQMGSFNLVQTVEGLEAYDLAIFTRVLGWTKEEVDVFNAKVRKELGKKGVHALIDFWIVWGQKPAAL
ncbi:putative methyltransferase domain-containing protein [Diplodia seriata]|uniref:Putative methyltransferase domain-containing protein n=1 Tax=Diplodia seriata TaxID=420778 RepID=A0A0G2H4V1_9PEZI|nr:putative methyltransferase domain-containing protein [Diplodia seriata]